jgi:hypothetical protein
MVLSDLAAVEVTHIYASRRLVAQDGELAVPLPASPSASPSGILADTTQVPLLAASDFILRAPASMLVMCV